MTTAQAGAPSLVQMIDNGATTAQVWKTLRGGYPVDAIDADGRRAMDAAMARQDYRMADMLIGFGANPPVYKGDPNGAPYYDGNNTTIAAELKRDTALTYYIKHANWFRPIYEVIANGADVNLKNPQGETPLQTAVNRKWPYVAVQLAKRNAWLDSTALDHDEIIDTTTGATRLLSVILEGADADAVKKMLEDGADSRKPDNQGLTPLAAARALRWTAVEELLIQHGAKPNAGSLPDPNLRIGAENNTPLLSYAVSYQCCHNNYAHTLLEAGADPNAADSTGKSPVHWAAVYNRVWLFGHLEAFGADIFKADEKNGLRPLHYACMNNRFEIAERILETCPLEHINEPVGESRSTPLHLAAARNGSFDLVAYLIDLGAYVNVRNAYGDTPLHSAIDARDADVVHLLLCNGADVDKANEGKRYNPPLFSLINSRNESDNEILQHLLNYGADPDIRATESINGPQKGDSLIYFAIRYSKFDAARILLDSGADPHGTAHNGQSAMEYCLHLRTPQGIQLLLEKGFDPLRTFEYTQKWTGAGDVREEHHKGSALDTARALVEKFGADSEYAPMLKMIENHIRAQNPAPAQRPRRAAP